MTVSAPVALSAPNTDPPPAADAPAPNADEVIAKQRPLIEAATLVRSAVEASGVDGLASIVLEDSSVSVWWKGGQEALPADVAAAVESAGAIAPVEVSEAANSRSELVEASTELEADLSADPDFVGIAAEPDGSGLKVKVDPESAGAEVAPLSSVDVPDADVPTSVVEVERPTDVGRADDAAPWSGGAKMVNSTLSVSCTSGFGVDTPDGPAILTAGHCGDKGDRFTNAKGKNIGKVGQVNKTLDIEIIPTTEVTNKIYIGDQNSNETLTVTDGGAPFVGEMVCQSGNTSAGATGDPVCDMEIKEQGTDSQQLWEAEQLTGETPARPGDSGGPVYSDQGDGTVIARGTTTWVGGNRMGFGGFETSVNEFDVSIPGADSQPPTDPPVYPPVDPPVDPPTDPKPPVDPTDPPSDGTVGPVRSALEDRCMDVQWAVNDDGTPVQGWECNDTDAQVWTQQADGSLQALDKCLATVDGGTENGTELQLASCDDSAGQQWSYMADSESWQNPESGRCIDYPLSSRDWGVRLQLLDCNGTAAQRTSLPGA